MLELQTPEPTFESQHGHPEADGRTPTSGLDRWWETPALVPPPPPNPSIYGLDAAEVAIGGLHVGSGSTVVDEVAAQIDHDGPSNLNAMIGMSNAVSAQTGARRLDRKTYLQKADAGRGLAMNAQLMLTAKNVFAVVNKLYDTMAEGETDSERSPDSYVERLAAVLAEAKEEKGKIALITAEKFADSSIRDGLRHLSRAAHDLDRAIQKAQTFARNKKVTDPKLVSGITDHGVSGDVNRLTGVLNMREDTSNVPSRVDETEQKLKSTSLDESLDGLLHASEALVLGVREGEPKAGIEAALPALRSSARMLKASLDGMKTSPAHRSAAAKILSNLTDAVLDASGHKLDGMLSAPHAEVKSVIKDLNNLPKGRK